MSRIVIVPDTLRHAINTAIEAALLTMPAEAAEHRERFYSELLAFYDEHGYLPTFSIIPTPTEDH